VYPGALGENFTTAGLDRRRMRFGDRYRVGSAVIELTRMRVPCATLDVFNSPERPRIQEAIYDAQVKAGDPASPKWGLSGFYARTVMDGLVRTGDRITFLDALA
jgi:MOSC domain-containing protein YiiM